MPSDEEVYGALLYLDAHASALTALSSDHQREAALERVLLWQYVRERLDRLQDRAISDARAAGAPWTALAPALAVSSPSAAYNKARRLRVAALAEEVDGEQLRRTPEAVRKAEQRIATRRRAEERELSAIRKRHDALLRAAGRLVDERDALLRDEDVDYWLEELQEVLPRCETPTQMAGLSRYAHALVRALRKAEGAAGRPLANTPEAHAAYAAVASLFDPG
ncbi:hypothetical protein [Streptomyces parvulus]|uniref:Uncharacterized protein n=1 Tax=Streptomyces parvulus TaxID=146923 RepID=A0A369UWF7_9ACTN|nr:hypothetical protein [Streptomyces parvulus]RDD84345.1 hypothetical protein DVZ84_35650 [Streptomyces parvulus]